MDRLESRILVSSAFWVGCLYLLTSLIMIALNIPITIPWGLILLLGIMALPFAYCLVIGGGSLQNHLISKRAIGLYGFSIGSILLLLYRLDSQSLILTGVALFIFSIWHCLRKNYSSANGIFCSFILIVAFYGFIGNLNFLALKTVAGNLNDPSLRASDLFAYALLFGNSINYNGIFPLIKSDFVFGIFQNAYFMLFFGIFFSVILIVQERGPIIHFFSVLFSCYLTGLVIFLIFPAIGPCIYYPESFAEQFHGSMTHRVMQGFLNGYEAVKEGTIKGAGVGYFVAFPSLHVAVAVILQYFAFISPLHFWMMAPINAAIIVSTVFLGYHYLIDIPAGIFLALSSILFFNRVFKPAKAN
jgi:hypothetical protein